MAMLELFSFIVVVFFGRVVDRLVVLLSGNVVPKIYRAIRRHPHKTICTLPWYVKKQVLKKGLKNLLRAI